MPVLKGECESARITTKIERVVFDNIFNNFSTIMYLKNGSQKLTLQQFCVKQSVEFHMSKTILITLLKSVKKSVKQNNVAKKSDKNNVEKK